MKRLLTAIAVLALLVTPAGAQDLDKAREALENGDYPSALRELRPLAEQGDADAQASLGAMYAFGSGVAQDHAEALKWYRLAADQGHASAQNNLGFIYGTAQGVPQDFVEAHMWYNLSASRGSAIAADNRDLIAENMTPADISKAQRMAREWLERHPR